MLSADNSLPSREDALAIVHEYTQSESLRKHMLSVEAAMRAYAEKFGEDPERWGLAGLVHDFDYERFPNDAHSPTEEHPAEGVRILRARGFPEDILEAILGHANYSGVPRVSMMANRATDSPPFCNCWAISRATVPPKDQPAS